VAKIVRRIIMKNCIFFPLGIIDLTKEGEELHEILIHRSNLKNDLIQEFSTDEVLPKKLSFGIVGTDGKLEEGQGTGVEREVLSSFFEEFYDSCCTGASEKVPLLRHDMLISQWKAVGRIICYSLKSGYFPLRLSYAFMKATFFNEDSVTKEELISSFLKYLSGEDKETLIKSMSSFPDDINELCDVLSSYNCYSKPTDCNLDDLVFQLAHKELIQKPRYVSNCWGSVFKLVKFPEGFPLENLQSIYELKTPSGRKVINLYDCTPVSPQEHLCFEHLKKFTKNLSQDNLPKFLKLMTGADIITVNIITVEFSKLSGVCRRPIFRTCGPTLELPNTYNNYNELAEEIMELLKHPFSFHFV